MTSIEQLEDIGLGYGFFNFDAIYLKTRMRTVYENQPVDYQVELKAWKGDNFCPCIFKSGAKKGRVCNIKAYVGQGHTGPCCYIHRNTERIIRVDQLPAPAPPAPEAPRPKGMN
jgi:hypothetical protein